MNMKREITILITETGAIKVMGDDIPDDWREALEVMVGPQEVAEELGELINDHLCG